MESSIGKSVTHKRFKAQGQMIDDCRLKVKPWGCKLINLFQRHKQREASRDVGDGFLDALSGRPLVYKFLFLSDPPEAGRPQYHLPELPQLNRTTKTFNGAGGADPPEIGGQALQRQAGRIYSPG